MGDDSSSREGSRPEESARKEPELVKSDKLIALLKKTSPQKASNRSPTPVLYTDSDDSDGDMASMKVSPKKAPAQPVRAPLQPMMSKAKVGPTSQTKPSTSTVPTTFKPLATSTPTGPPRVMKGQSVVVAAKRPLVPGTPSGGISMMKAVKKTTPVDQKEFYDKYPWLRPSQPAAGATPKGPAGGAADSSKTPGGQPSSPQKPGSQPLRAYPPPKYSSGTPFVPSARPPRAAPRTPGAPDASFPRPSGSATQADAASTPVPSFRAMAQPFSVTRFADRPKLPTDKPGVTVSAPGLNVLDFLKRQKDNSPRKPWDEMTLDERQEQRRKDMARLEEEMRMDEEMRNRSNPRLPATLSTPTIPRSVNDDDSRRRFASRTDDQWEDSDPIHDILKTTKKEGIASYRSRFVPPPPKKVLDPFAPPPKKRISHSSSPFVPSGSTKEASFGQSRLPPPSKGAETGMKKGPADDTNDFNDDFGGGLSDHGREDANEMANTSSSALDVNPSKALNAKKDDEKLDAAALKLKKELDQETRRQELLKPSMKQMYTDEMAALAKEQKRFERQLLEKMSKEHEKLPALPSLSQLTTLRHKPDDLRVAMDRLVDNMKKIGSTDGASNANQGELTKHLNQMMDTMKSDVFLGTVRTEVYEAEDNMFEDAVSSYVKHSSITRLNSDDYSRAMQAMRIEKAEHEKRRMADQLRSQRRRAAVGKVSKTPLSKLTAAQRRRRLLPPPRTPPGSPPGGSPPVSVLGSRDPTPERRPEPVTPPGSPPPDTGKTWKHASKKLLEVTLDDSLDIQLDDNEEEERKKMKMNEEVKRRNLHQLQRKYQYHTSEYSRIEQMRGVALSRSQQPPIFPHIIDRETLGEWMGVEKDGDGKMLELLRKSQKVNEVRSDEQGNQFLPSSRTPATHPRGKQQTVNAKTPLPPSSSMPQLGTQVYGESDVDDLMDWEEEEEETEAEVAEPVPMMSELEMEIRMKECDDLFRNLYRSLARDCMSKKESEQKINDVVMKSSSILRSIEYTLKVGFKTQRGREEGEIPPILEAARKKPEGASSSKEKGLDSKEDVPATSKSSSSEKDLAPKEGAEEAPPALDAQGKSAEKETTAKHADVGKAKETEDSVKASKAKDVQMVTQRLAALWKMTNCAPKHIRDLARRAMPTKDGDKAKAVLDLRMRIVNAEKLKGPFSRRSSQFGQRRADNSSEDEDDVSDDEPPHEDERTRRKRAAELRRVDTENRARMKAMEEEEKMRKQRDNQRSILGGVVVGLHAGEQLSKIAKKVSEDRPSTSKEAPEQKKTALIRKRLTPKEREALILAEFYEYWRKEHGVDSASALAEKEKQDGQPMPLEARVAYTRWLPMRNQEKVVRLNTGNLIDSVELELVEVPDWAEFADYEDTRPFQKKPAFGVEKPVILAPKGESWIDTLKQTERDRILKKNEMGHKLTQEEHQFLRTYRYPVKLTRNVVRGTAISDKNPLSLSVKEERSKRVRDAAELKKIMESRGMKILATPGGLRRIRVLAAAPPASIEDDVRAVMNAMLKKICGNDDVDALEESEEITVLPSNTAVVRPSILRRTQPKTVIWEPSANHLKLVSTSTAPAQLQRQQIPANKPKTIVVLQSTKPVTVSAPKDDVQQVLDDLLKRVCAEASPKRSTIVWKPTKFAGALGASPKKKEIFWKPVSKEQAKTLLTPIAPATRIAPAPKRPDPVCEVVDEMLNIVCGDAPRVSTVARPRTIINRIPVLKTKSVTLADKKEWLATVTKQTTVAARKDGPSSSKDADDEAVTMKGKIGESKEVEKVEKRKRKQSWEPHNDSDDEVTIMQETMDADGENAEEREGEEGEDPLIDSNWPGKKGFEQWEAKKSAKAIRIKPKTGIALEVDKVIAEVEQLKDAGEKLGWADCLRLVEDEKGGANVRMKIMKKKMEKMEKKWIAVDMATAEKTDAEKGGGPKKVIAIEPIQKRYFTTKAGKRILLKPRVTIKTVEKAGDATGPATRLSTAAAAAVATAGLSKAAAAAVVAATQKQSQLKLNPVGRQAPRDMPALDQTEAVYDVDDEDDGSAPDLTVPGSNKDTPSRRVLSKQEEERKRRAESSPEKPAAKKYRIGPMTFVPVKKAETVKKPQEKAAPGTPSSSAKQIIANAAAAAAASRVSAAGLSTLSGKTIFRPANRRSPSPPPVNRQKERERREREEKEIEERDLNLKRQQWEMRKNEATISRQAEQIELQKRLLGEMRKEMVKVFENAEKTSKSVKQAKRAMIGECHDFAEYRKLVDAREKLMNTMYEQAMEKMKTTIAAEETRRKGFDNYKRKAIRREKALIKEVEHTKAQLDKLQGQQQTFGLPKKAPACPVPFTKAPIRSRNKRVNFVIEAIRRVVGDGVEADDDAEKEQVKAIIERTKTKYGIATHMTVDQDHDFCNTHEIGYRKRLHMKKYLTKLGLDYFCTQRSFDKMRRELEEADGERDEDTEIPVKREKGEKGKKDGRGKKMIDPREISLGRSSAEEDGDSDIEEIILDDDYNLMEGSRRTGGGETSGAGRDRTDSRYTMSRFGGTRMVTSDEEYVEESDPDQPGPSNRYIPSNRFSSPSRPPLPSSSHYLHGPPIVQPVQQLQQRVQQNMQPLQQRMQQQQGSRAGERRGRGGARVRGGHAHQ